MLDGPGALGASSGCTDPASDCVCASMRMISCRNAGLFWFSATMRCKSIAADAGQSRRNKRALLLYGRKRLKRAGYELCGRDSCTCCNTCDAISVTRLT